MANKGDTRVHRILAAELERLTSEKRVDSWLVSQILAALMSVTPEDRLVIIIAMAIQFSVFQ